MTYLVLARKWRPRSFDTLVGQDHVVRALTHALQTQRLHHAWLFTGTRGVGKTTSAVNIAAALARGGLRVLVIDLDPQGNASTGLGLDTRAVDTSMYDVLLHDQPLEDFRRQPRKPQEAADVAVGEALVGGEIGKRGDVAAFQPLPPAPCPADGA